MNLQLRDGLGISVDTRTHAEPRSAERGARFRVPGSAVYLDVKAGAAATITVHVSDAHSDDYSEDSVMSEVI